MSQCHKNFKIVVFLIFTLVSQCHKYFKIVVFRIFTLVSQCHKYFKIVVFSDKVKMSQKFWLKNAIFASKKYYFYQIWSQKFQNSGFSSKVKMSLKLQNNGFRIKLQIVYYVTKKLGQKRFLSPKNTYLAQKVCFVTKTYVISETKMCHVTKLAIFVTL